MSFSVSHLFNFRPESGDISARRQFVALHLGHAGGQVGRVRSSSEEVLRRIPLGHRQAHDPPAMHLLSLPLGCRLSRHLELGLQAWRSSLVALK